MGYQPFFPGTPYYDASFRPYQRNLNKVRQLLDEAGVPTPIRWEVGVTPDPVKARVTQVVQAQLNEIGITLDIKQMDAGAKKAFMKAGNYTFDTGFGWWGYRPDPDQYLSMLTYSASNNNYGHI